MRLYECRYLSQRTGAKDSIPFESDSLSDKMLGPTLPPALVVKEPLRVFAACNIRVRTNRLEDISVEFFRKIWNSRQHRKDCLRFWAPTRFGRLPNGFSSISGRRCHEIHFHICDVLFMKNLEMTCAAEFSKSDITTLCFFASFMSQPYFFWGTASVILS